MWGIQATGTGGLRACILRVAGCATPTGSARHAGATASFELTFHLGHSMQADHDDYHMTPLTEPPSIELMPILRFHRILIPIGSSEIDHFDRAIQDINRYINPSASLNLLGLCTIFVSGLSGDIASDYQFHQTTVVNVLQHALDQIACQNAIDSSRITTCVREGGPPEVAAEAKRFQADLILLATPLWTNKTWLHSNIAGLKRLTSCSVLLWPEDFF